MLMQRLLRQYSFASLALCLAVQTGNAQGSSGFSVTKSFKIGSPGGWDYISVGPDKKVYVSHGTQVNILDKTTGDSLGVIPNTTGVHGIAFDNTTGKGYTSNGRLNTVTVFDIRTSATMQMGQIATGQKIPDAILARAISAGYRHLQRCRSHNLSVIDCASGKVTDSIALDGKPETAVSDGEGKVYVNIEDKNKISEVDMRTKTVIASWPLEAEGPTGLAFDKKTNRLFAGCDKQLVVMDATNGTIVSKLPIGNGCDGVGFDEGLKLVFASCGEGVVTVIKEASASSFSVIDSVPTKRSARTCAVDSRTHSVYLPAAETEPAQAGQLLA